MQKQLFFLIAALVILLTAAVFFRLNNQQQTAATVNGVAIPVSFIDRQVDLLKNENPTVFKGKAGAKRETDFRKAALNYIINLELISQEAKKQRLSPSAEQIEQEIAELKKGFSSEAKFNEALRRQNLTLTDLKRLVAYREAEVKMVAWLTKNVTVSEKEMHKFYQQNQAKFKQPELKRLKHILLKSKKEADKVETLLEKGLDFALAVQQFTKDEATRNRGGDLGYKALSQLPPVIAKNVSGLKKGERSAIFKTKEGYHLFQVDDVIPARLIPYKEARPQIKQMLLEKKRQHKFSRWLNRLKKKAKIDIKTN